MNLQSPSALHEVVVAEDVDPAYKISHFGQYLFIWFSGINRLGSSEYAAYYPLSIMTEFQAEGPWDCGADN